jgi:DNA-binding NtrC family response regulator
MSGRSESPFHDPGRSSAFPHVPGEADRGHDRAQGPGARSLPASPASPSTNGPTDPQNVDLALRVDLAHSLETARRRVLTAFERAYLDGLLRRTGGKVGRTAAMADINPRSLYDKMKRHGLRKEDYFRR